MYFKPNITCSLLADVVKNGDSDRSLSSVHFVSIPIEQSSISTEEEVKDDDYDDGMVNLISHGIDFIYSRFHTLWTGNRDQIKIFSLR